MKCANCGADLPEGSQFCFDCGAAILASPPPPPAYPQPAQPTPPPPVQLTSPPAPGHTRPPHKKVRLFLWIAALGLFLCLGIVAAGVSGWFGFLPNLPFGFSYNQSGPDVGQEQPGDELQASITPWGGPTPTFSFVTPCGNGPVLLIDSFDRNPPAGQAFLDQTVMRFWQDQYNGILQGGSQSQSLVSPVIYPAFQAADFNLEITVIPQTLQGDDGFGIIFRGVQNGNNLSSYYIVYIKPNDSQVVFSTRIEPNWSEYQSYNLLPASLGTEGGGRVRLEVLHDHFRLFVNGRYETTFQSAALTQPGLIGLALLTSAGETADEVHFNNLDVYAPGACP